MSEAVDWNTYTVQELKTVLAKYGLPVSGVKAELINRLQEHEKKLDQEELASQEAKSSGLDETEEGEQPENGDGEEGEDLGGEEEEDGHYEDEHGEYEEGEEGEHRHGDLDLEEEDLTGEKGDLELLEDSMDKELQDMMGGDVSETEEDMEFVTLDKCGDADPEERGGEGSGGDKDQAEPGETKDDESLPPLPPDPMRKFLYKSYSSSKKQAGLCVSKLSTKDVLCGSVVEWANRAMYFCVNHGREGKGTAVLNFCTQQECKEAKEALTRSLGDDVKVTFIGDVPEDEVRNGISYEFENSHSFAFRTIIIDAAPENASVEQVSQLFPEAVLVVKFDINKDQYTWGHKEYSLPDSIKKAFILEYGTAKAAARVLEDEKGYELDGQKLEVKLVDTYEDKYKRHYAKKLNEVREKRWENLERKRKAMKNPEKVNLSDSERLDLYNKMDILTQKRLRIAAMKDLGWDEKLLRKNEVTAEILDIVRKVDCDADRRMEDTQKFPESVRSMTKHSRECFKRTPAYKNYQEYIAKKKQSPGGGYRGRYFRGSSSRYDRGRDRESYGSRRRSASGEYREYEGKRRRVDDYDDRKGRHDDGTVDMLKSLTETLTHKMSQMERMLPAKEKYRRSDSRSESTSRYYDNYSSGEGYSKSPGGRQGGDYHSPQHHQHQHHHHNQHHYRGESSYRGSGPRRGTGYQGRHYNPNYRGRGTKTYQY